MTWWVQDSSASVVLTDGASGIVAFHQECPTAPDVLGVGSLSRGKGNPRLPQAPTNSREIQQTTLEHRLQERLIEHEQGRGARITQVQREAGGTWRLASVEPGGADRERQLKQHGAARRCPICKTETAARWREATSSPQPEPQAHPEPQPEPQIHPELDAELEPG
jgi:hypothetical protein